MSRMAWEALAFAMPCAAALLLIRAAWWNRIEPPRSAMLLVALALGGGCGLASYTYALALLVGGGRFAVACAFDALLLVGAAAWARRTRVAPARAGETIRRDAHTALLVAVVVAALAASAAFAANTLVNPHGEWDAWAIWNVRARFLYRAGPEWRRAFSAQLMHTDYPPLLPSAIAHAWAYAGTDDNATPVLVAFVFGSALVALLWAAVERIRGRAAANLAALCLLGTPAFLQRSAWQYADVPLAFFLLATLAMLAIAPEGEPNAPVSLTPTRGALAIAGACAGMAAWTKNEGVLFVLAIALSAALSAARQRRVPVNGIAAFALGLAPGALLLVGFKLTLAPPSYLADQSTQSVLTRLSDPSRYALIGAAAAREVIDALGVLAIVIPVAAVLLGRTGALSARHTARRVALVLTIVALGYVGVYALTPLDLAWQLHHSLDRLILQIWPSVLFAVFLFLASPDDWQRISPATPQQIRGKSEALAAGRPPRRRQSR